MRTPFRNTSLIFITLLWTTTDAIKKSDEITLPCASCVSRQLRGVEGGNITIHFRINSAMIKDFTVFYVQVILLHFKRHHWLETFIYRHQNNRIFCPWQPKIESMDKGRYVKFINRFLFQGLVQRETHGEVVQAFKVWLLENLETWWQKLHITVVQGQR